MIWWLNEKNKIFSLFVIIKQVIIVIISVIRIIMAENLVGLVWLKAKKFLAAIGGMMIYVMIDGLVTQMK